MKIRFDDEIDIMSALDSAIECIQSHNLYDNNDNQINDRKEELINEIKAIKKKFYKIEISSKRFK